MVVESSCDEGKKGSGLNVRRNRVRGLVGKHARARLAICPFSASVVPKAARCLYPSKLRQVESQEIIMITDNR